jgi:magnesium transporter
MAEDHPATAPLGTATAMLPFRNPDGAISDAFLAAVSSAVEADDRAAASGLLGRLHEADVGELLAGLAPEDRTRLVILLGDGFDFTALTETDEAVRLQILRGLPPETVAAGLARLESDDAVYIVEDLDDEEKAGILALLPVPERTAVQRGLDYPDESAGRRMQTEFVAVPPFWTIGQTIDYLRGEADLPEQFYEVYVIDPRFRLIGSVGLDRLLRTPRTTRISAIMHEARHQIRADEDQEEAARRFERYNLISAAVVDDSDRLVGVLTIDDVVDVIQAEAEEDIRALAGVGDEEISDSIFYAWRARSIWLLFNLGTAALASVVIAFFDGTIEEMVALAVLMPIVASLGGNAASQTMTVTVRAIATRDLRARNAFRIIVREVAVGAINGVVFALLIGAASAAWFGNPALGVVIGAAMVINMISAGLGGILIPLGLNKLGADPAVASSVFVTMVTDVVGFFAFLGLATWWFGIG